MRDLLVLLGPCDHCHMGSERSDASAPLVGRPIIYQEYSTHPLVDQVVSQPLVQLASFVLENTNHD